MRLFLVNLKKAPIPGAIFYMNANVQISFVNGSDHSHLSVFLFHVKSTTSSVGASTT